jgi:hypothetical protein
MGVTQTAPTLSTAASGIQDGRVGYYAFSLSVTEYCEASEGTPLKARGWWSAKDSGAGQKVSFEDGRMATAFNLGYTDNLLVGPCKYPEMSSLSAEANLISLLKMTIGLIESVSITEAATGIKTSMVWAIAASASLGLGLETN